MDLMQRRRLLMMDSAKAYTVTGNPVSFETNLAKPLRGMVIPFSPVQEGTGDPSPSNVRSISGTGAINISHTGKNIFDQEHFQWGQTGTVVYVPIFVGDGTFTMSTDFPDYDTKDVFLIPGSVSSGGSSADNGVSISHPRTFASIGGYITVASRYNSSRGFPSRSNWQIEVGSSASPYSPYSGSTYPVAFPADPGTIYGGYVDLAQGVVVAEWWCKTLDGSDTFNIAATSYIGETTTRGYIGNTVPQIASSNDYSKVFLCDCAKYSISVYEENAQTAKPVRGTDKFELNLRLLNSETGITQQDTAAEAKTKFNQYLASNPVHVCWKLDTPITYPLSSVIPTTLKGQNVIWTDTNGTNTVTYLKRG